MTAPGSDRVSAGAYLSVSSESMSSEGSAAAGASHTIAPDGATLLAAAIPTATFKVKILNIGTEIDCDSSLTLLDAAVAAGLDYPYACASGNCGTCISRLESGTVSMLPRSDTSLSAEQATSGHILACRAQPRSDVSVIWLARGRR